MRVLALDLGARRIGLAISDPEGDFAFPMQAIESVGRKRDVEAIRKLAGEREVGCVVVGLPLHMDGRAGPEAEAARRFAKELARATGLAVETLDERWTTVEAERALREAGWRGRRRPRGEVDSAAAAILLRTWLDRERATRERDAAPEPPQ